MYLNGHHIEVLFKWCLFLHNLPLPVLVFLRFLVIPYMVCLLILYWYVVYRKFNGIETCCRYIDKTACIVRGVLSVKILVCRWHCEVMGWIAGIRTEDVKPTNPVPLVCVFRYKFLWECQVLEWTYHNPWELSTTCWRSWTAVLCRWAVKHSSIWVWACNMQITYFWFVEVIVRVLGWINIFWHINHLHCLVVEYITIYIISLLSEKPLYSLQQWQWWMEWFPIPFVVIVNCQ